MRTAYFTLLSIFLFSLSGQSQNCLPNGITFTAQAQIDNFTVNYPGCSVIEGYVQIFGSDITNLNGLNGVTAIGNNLIVDFCPMLTSLSGLGNITAFGGDIRVSSNSSLTSLEGLNNLTSAVGNLWVWDNSSLTSLSGLSQLTAVGNYLWISGNPMLTSLSSLGNVNSVGGLTITSNVMLTDLNGLANLDSVGQIQISGNAALTSLSGLGNITLFGGGGLHISNNPLLTSLSGLDNITSVGGEGLYITSNAALTSLSGLDNITFVGGNGVHIIGNSALANLNGLKNLTSVESYVEIRKNSELTSLSGLNKLVTVGDALWIGENPKLTNLNGLNNLTSIGELIISSNDLLADLSGLGNGTYLWRGLSILENSTLTTLNGLNNLNSVKNSVRILHNPMLTSLNALADTEFSIGELWIGGNAALTNLTGLEKITSVDSLLIYSNNSLSNLDALKNITKIEDWLSIADNPSLSDCAIFPVCDCVLNSPYTQLYIINNATGCDTPAEVATQCDIIPIVVEVQMDQSSTCSQGIPVPNLQTHLKGTAQMTIKPTDANGIATFRYLESGPFTVGMPQVNEAHWGITQSTQTLTASNGGDSIQVFICLTPLVQCPEMTVSLGLPSNFRGCLVNSDALVAAQNTGTILAEGVKIAVVVPPVFELESSAPIVSAQNGDTLFFEMGDLMPFETAVVAMTVRTKCDTFLLEQTLCWETVAAMDNPCPNTLPPHSEIKLTAECVNGTIVRFTVKNIGDAPTQGWHAYKIIRNHEILYDNGFNLAAQQSLSFDFPADGATWRMEATKFADGTQTAVALENCGGLTPGYITAFWLDKGPIDYDFDCRQVIGSYDPNQKTAVPTGVGWQRTIVANQPLQYTIDFQNTGTDTAFRVLLRDELPSHLDVSTFYPGASSHPCTWEIRGNLLEVLYSPIMLPDSNVNEPASRGFFSFTIGQKPNLPNGTYLYNAASIIFDFNPPIWTNTVYHVIGKLTVRVDEAQPFVNVWRVWGNPVHDAAIFRAEELTAGEKRFELHDAAGRFIHSAWFQGQEYEFRRDALPVGLYFFTISDAQGRVFSGKIVVAD